MALCVAACAGSTDNVITAEANRLAVGCSSVAPDFDADGLSDACELQLAVQFAPILSVSAAACNVVRVGESNRLGGGYRYIVAPREGGQIRIAYLPAYYQDCGWEGPKCRLPWVDCAPHAGDSEMIIVDVARDSWRVSSIFLSAHCFGRLSSSCRWYEGTDLNKFSWPQGREAGPRIWVANGRNANYPSKNTCDTGHWLIDTCAGERLTYRFPIVASANLGSRAVSTDPRGCVSAEAVDPSRAHTAAGAFECFWDPAMRFRGWQMKGPGVTGYNRYLDEVAGM